MYCLSDICSLCLSPTKNLTSFSSKDVDGTVIEEKLKSFLIELIHFKPSVPKYICNNCLENLNYVHKFRQSCLQNMVTLNKYVENSEVNGLHKNLSISLTNIKCEKDPIESENEDNSETCIGENELHNNVLNEERINENNYLYHENNIFLQDSNETNTTKVFIKSEFNDSERNSFEYENNSNNTHVPYEDFLNFNEEKHIINDNESINSNSYTQENSIEDIIVNDECDTQMSFEDSKEIEENEFISSDYSNNISPAFQEMSEEVELRLIPKKSKDAYYKEYEKLIMWMQSKNTDIVNEKLMLAYMTEMSSVYKSSTLWCIHSKLQAMLRIKKGVDLATFKNLQAFMKGINKSYEDNKSFVFTEGELHKFFVQAPDANFLFLKIVAICGIFGSCRRHEMCDLRLSDITIEDSALIINIRPSRTEIGRKFAVVDSGIPYVQLFNKYLSLRPEKVATDRVFLKYTNGKCTNQVVGINTFGKCPALVAKYLKLPDCEKYTGHAFRRTSATILANSGMGVDELKRQVGWRSSVAAGYIEESTEVKLKVSETIADVVNRASVPSFIDTDINTLEDSELITENESSVASASSIDTINDHMNETDATENESPDKNHKSAKEIILYKCPVCQNVFISPSQLEKHSRVHTGERPFECPTCNKTFKRPEHLKNHSRIHTGEKPFECEICLKTFTQQGHLSEHKRIHSNDRPFKCPVCDMTFTVNSTLTRHLRRHTDQKPFQCSLCPHKFLTKSGLKLHIRSHTGEKPYECVLCHFKFTTSGRLTVHMRTHTGDRPYQCCLCQYKAATSTHLKTHMRKHGGEGMLPVGVNDLS